MKSEPLPVELEQRQRLIKLADYLDTVVSGTFSMASLNRCAWGYAQKSGLTDRRFSYDAGKEVFGVTTRAFAWLFGLGHPSSYQDPHAAAAQIRYYLKHGDPKTTDKHEIERLFRNPDGSIHPDYGAITA